MVGNQANQRAANLALVMRAIRMRPGTSRTEIAATTGLTKSTVGNVIRSVAARGLVAQEPASAAGEPGRPRVGLAIVPTAAPVIGLEARPDAVVGVVLGLDGSVLERWRVDLPAPERSMARLWSIVGNEIANHGAPFRPVGAGVALPATVDPYRGRMLVSEDFDLTGVDVAAIAASTVPVVVENDANAVAWAAIASAIRPDGAAQAGATAAPDLLVVTGRRDGTTMRVGSSVVIGGRVHYGRDYGGGEVRSASWRRGMSAELVAAADDRDTMLLELLDTLAPPISILRPEQTIVAGDLVGYRARMDELARTARRGGAVDPAVSGSPFVSLGDDGATVATGAALMVLEHLFAVPTPERPRPIGLPSWIDLLEA